MPSMREVVVLKLLNLFAHILGSNILGSDLPELFGVLVVGRITTNREIVLLLRLEEERPRNILMKVRFLFLQIVVFSITSKLKQFRMKVPVSYILLF